MAQSFDHGGSVGVVLLAAVMTAPVEFDHQAIFYTQVVCNTGSQWHLLTELEPAELSAAKARPGNLLRVFDSLRNSLARCVRSGLT